MTYTNAEAAARLEGSYLTGNITLRVYLCALRFLFLSRDAVRPC